MKKRNVSLIKPYALILPALALAVVFAYRPFILTLLNSLHTVSLPVCKSKLSGKSFQYPALHSLFCSHQFNRLPGGCTALQ